MTIYSAVNGTMIDNGQPFPSINSLIGTVQQEPDGSYDLYFAPELPAEVPEGTWIKTNLGEGFAVALRLYGATMPFYAKPGSLTTSSRCNAPGSGRDLTRGGF